MYARVGPGHGLGHPLVGQLPPLLQVKHLQVAVLTHRHSYVRLLGDLVSYCENIYIYTATYTMIHVNNTVMWSVLPILLFEDDRLTLSEGGPSQKRERKRSRAGREREGRSRLEKTCH